jgi:hypothetical protein
MRATSGFPVLFAISILAAPALAAELSKEDLSACKLPHGEVVLPSRNSAEGAKGYIFRFSDGRFALGPFRVDGTRPGSLQEMFERMRKERTGDIMFSPLNGGTLVAISGRISDLGAGFLHEFGGKKLSRPAPVVGQKERTGKGEGTPGAIEEITEGHCYLVETTDGKFTLLRYLQKQPAGGLVQYVLQPDGSLKFDVPKEVTAPPSQPAAAAAHAPPAPLAPADRDQAEKGVRDFGAALFAGETEKCLALLSDDFTYGPIKKEGMRKEIEEQAQKTRAFIAAGSKVELAIRIEETAAVEGNARAKVAIAATKDGKESVNHQIWWLRKDAGAWRLFKMEWNLEK